MDENDGGAASTFVLMARYDGGELQPAKTASKMQRHVACCVPFFSPRKMCRGRRGDRRFVRDRTVGHAHIGRLAIDRPKVGLAHGSLAV